MAEEKNTRKMPHSLILDSRASLTATGVSNVDSFDDEVVVADTDYGELIIKGKNLQISRLSVESGELVLTGEIASAVYNEPRPTRSVFSRIFR